MKNEILLKAIEDFIKVKRPNYEGKNPISLFCCRYCKSKESVVRNFINGKGNPKGDSKFINDACNRLNMKRDDLFPEYIYYINKKDKVKESIDNNEYIDMSSDEVMNLVSEFSTKKYAENKFNKKLMNSIISDCLNPREQNIINSFYGIGDYEERSADWIARDYGVSKARIHSIIQNSIKKLAKDLSDIGINNC